MKKTTKDALVKLLNVETETGGAVTIRLKKSVFDRYTAVRDEYKSLTGKALPLGEMGDIMFADLCDELDEIINSLKGSKNPAKDVKNSTAAKSITVKEENQIEIK